jgi:hypothetical protein
MRRGQTPLIRIAKHSTATGPETKKSTLVMVATMRMPRFNISDLLNARVARAQQNNKV